MNDKVELFILLNQVVDILALVFLSADNLCRLLGDADADCNGAPRGGATLCKMVITHWCKPLDRDAVGLNGLLVCVEIGRLVDGIVEIFVSILVEGDGGSVEDLKLGNLG